MRRINSVVAAALVFASATSRAQEHAHPAGDQRLGSVHFPTTCKPSVAPTFNRGVALLHSFEFGAAMRAFNEVLTADTNCAMAYWGLSVSWWTNPMTSSQRPLRVLQQGKRTSDAAARLGASKREKGYIAAAATLFADYERIDQAARVAAYERAMRDLVVRQPADTEAKIFHALSLVAAASPTDKTFAKQLEAGRILESLWPALPNHPGIAHYIIHTYDYPPLADKARRAAEKYAAVAPSAAHALHMPSHTFTRVGMWEQSVASNLRSRETALREGSIAEALHASDYLTYAYLQLGKEAEAKAVLDGLPALAAQFDPTAVTGAAPGSAGVFALAAIPARWTMERRAWREAAALVPRTTAFPWAEAMTHFARAIGASRVGDLVKARLSADSLDAISRRLAATGESYWAEQVSIQSLGARAWIALAERRESDALARMGEAVTREDASDKSAVSPGPLAPARELLADMLLALNRPAEARAEYRKELEKEPGRRLAIQGASGADGGESADGIQGTWRVHRYEIWDAAGQPQQPLGAAPSGYISFDRTGHALIQLMQPGNVATFGAYYGTYTIDAAARTIAIRVEGGNIPEYLGTVQTRPFVLRGDTLVLGVAREYQATLVRAGR